MSRSQVLAAFLLGMLLTGSLAQAGAADGQSFQTWAAFGVGSSRTLETTADTPAGQETFTIVEKLIEKADDHLVLEGTMTMVVDGQPRTSPPSKQTLRSATADPIAGMTSIGKEDVTVAGKTFSCKIYTLSIPGAGATTKAKIWMCSDVPGGLVKAEVDGPSKVRTALKSFEMK